MTDDQRRHHRIGVALEVKIRGETREGNAFEETVHSNDVSRGGCSFQTEHDLPEGTELEIEIYRRITGPLGQTPFLTQGSVVRIVSADPTHRIVGVRFTGPQFPTYSSESTSSE